MRIALEISLADKEPARGDHPPGHPGNGCTDRSERCQRISLNGVSTPADNLSIKSSWVAKPAADQTRPTHDEHDGILPS